MATTRRAAHFENDAEWNAVWDDYEARRGDLRVVGGHDLREPRPEPAGVPGIEIATGRPLPRRHHRSVRKAKPHRARPALRPRRVLGRAFVGAVLFLALLAALWAALPWLLAMRVTASLRSPDPSALTRQWEPAATLAGLREALLAEVPPGLDGAAGRWVADLAGRMAASAEARGTAADWIRLRATTRETEGVSRLEVLRDFRTIGPARFRLDYGPERGPGGMSFDVAWQGSDFRITAVRTLDAPPRELPRRRPGGPVVAMR